MGRPKLSADMARTVVISVKVRVAEKEALDKILEIRNAERRERGDPTELGITDFVRGAILSAAREHGVAIDDAPKPKPAPKAAKSSRKPK